MLINIHDYKCTVTVITYEVFVFSPFFFLSLNEFILHS